uniref:Uncharacterized protein n=1 Tax=Sinorhizobium meliloti (strain SM11) TaxID=707241 RepID=A4KVD1_SINMM|nr:hypothetical protein [Sinorhizobium meliloti SM11]
MISQDWRQRRPVTLIEVLPFVSGAKPLPALSFNLRAAHRLEALFALLPFV